MSAKVNANAKRHIVIDARRMADYGIGTYIRNLIRALAAAGSEYRYTLIVPAAASNEALAPGPNFSTAVYRGPDTGLAENFMFPAFLRQFRADLCHIPLNSVAYWMPRPYVLTIHDMSTLLYPSMG